MPPLRQLVSGLAVVLAACGGTAARPADLGGALSLLRGLHESGPGRAATKNRLETRVGACVTKQGWPYSARDFSIGAQPGSTPSDRANPDYAEKNGYQISRDLIGPPPPSSPFDDPNQPYATTLDGATATRFHQAVSECHAEVEKAFLDNSQPLYDAYLAETGAGFGDQQAIDLMWSRWARCMKAAVGKDYGTGAEPQAELRLEFDRLQAQIGSEKSWEMLDPGQQKQVAAFAAREHQMAVADATCFKPEWEIVSGALKEAEATFMVRHEAELRKLVADWAA